ncbi:MAG: hypothetical protein K8R23_03820 [Chthoniobacter sp.]|nr:hypothetical protein [Chthoniobacter sp.]
MKTPNTLLRPIFATACLTGALLTCPLHSQTTATTTPVGFVTVTIPAAPSANVPSSRALSIPLYKSADFVGAVAAVDSVNQLSLTGAAFTVGQFASTTAPRLVRVKTSATAAHVGKFFIITANTATQLTVDLTGTGVTNIADVITAGVTPDTVEILPANTIGTVFGNASTLPTLAAGATASAADNVLLWNGTAWDTYFWTGTAGSPNNIWKRTGNTDRSNTVIYPDDGVFVVHKDTGSQAVITLMGTVPSTSEQSDIGASGNSFLANRFPTDTTLGSLGLHLLPGWSSGATANSADTVNVWNATTSAWDTYFWTGLIGSPNNIWKRTGNTDRSSTVISAGTAIYIAHTGASLNLTQALPYTP